MIGGINDNVEIYESQERSSACCSVLRLGRKPRIVSFLYIVLQSTRVLVLTFTSILSLYPPPYLLLHYLCDPLT